MNGTTLAAAQGTRTIAITAALTAALTAGALLGLHSTG